MIFIFKNSSFPESREREDGNERYGKTSFRVPAEKGKGENEALRAESADSRLSIRRSRGTFSRAERESTAGAAGDSTFQRLDFFQNTYPICAETITSSAVENRRGATHAVNHQLSAS